MVWSMPKNRKQSGYVERYGLYWEQLVNPIEIELEMIRHGGEWKTRQGKTVGNGMFFHFKQLQTLLWPEEDWHRWRELTLKTFLKNRVIGVLGPASSAKTHDAALFALCVYYAFPACCTALCCSTEREMLEKRIWGEIKTHHKRARASYEGLPGQLTESKQIIMTDERLEFVDGRDARNSVCFPPEAIVDTPTGPIRIDRIKVGQRVSNATGIGTVTKTYCQFAKRLLRVSLSDGRSIDCTEEHPFLTRRGWIKAIELETFDMVFSARELQELSRQAFSKKQQQGMCLLLGEMPGSKTVRRMRKTNRQGLSKQNILQREVQGSHYGKNMYSVQSQISWLESEILVGWKNHWQILQQDLRWKVGDRPPSTDEENNNPLPALQETNEASPLQPHLLLKDMSQQATNSSMLSVRKSLYIDPGISCKAALSFLQQYLQEKSNWSKERKAESNSNSRRTPCLEPVPGIYCQIPHKHWINDKTQTQALVSNRLSLPRPEASNRNRRGDTQNPIQANLRQKKNADTGGAWVDSVKVLESRSDKRFNESAGGYKVHNLEVSGHPSYSVNGVIVHNCGVPCKKGGNYVGLSSYIGVKNKIVLLVADEGQFLPRAFIDAISNLNKNQDSRGIPKELAGLKVIVLGNPKDITDSLGIVCEPSAAVGGWDGGIDQTGPTKTWPTRFDGGIALQLVGSDCPNMDVSEDVPPPFPYLITRKAIQQDIQFYGQDSVQYTMMNEGRFPRGEGSRRVITRAMCLKFKAMESPVWKDETRVRIGGLDAAYSGIGGDRTIFTELQFGLDIEDKQILAMIVSVLVPVTYDNPDIPEDQIAKFVMDQCKTRNIPPENLFFDSTGRGSLALALARLWSPNVVGIEFGGKPSDRQVSSQIPIKAHDYFSKKVSELWFSVRHAILSGQFRGLSEEVMQEGIYKEWRIAGANKTEVETKADTKIKSGRSSDLFDSLIVAVEGARQRGFIISSTISPKSTALTNDFKERIEEKLSRMRKSWELTYS